ncbi:methionine--tRNA ligase [mine drainage metagenome]|uniref:Methionine--tRNA ligase n=1 Tax=mine drainage metagenome TaxID=410659 RepID=A0A1J5Q859_9ZZZZ
MRISLNLVRIYAVLSQPFIPEAAASMMAGMRSDDWSWPTDVAQALEVLPVGHVFDVPEVLFRKITDEERAEWQQKFAGVRT